MASCATLGPGRRAGMLSILYRPLRANAVDDARCCSEHRIMAGPEGPQAGRPQVTSRSGAPSRPRLRSVEGLDRVDVGVARVVRAPGDLEAQHRHGAPYSSLPPRLPSAATRSTASPLPPIVPKFVPPKTASCPTSRRRPRATFAQVLGQRVLSSSLPAVWGAAVGAGGRGARAGGRRASVELHWLATTVTWSWSSFTTKRIIIVCFITPTPFQLEPPTRRDHVGRASRPTPSAG
jgi:hypothetical protein